MSSCARCGQCICTTAGKIALNKVWHRGCFCCYSCNRPLTVNSAKIYYGEVFCACCCPKCEETYPFRLCKVNSTPSIDCCPKLCFPPKPKCCSPPCSDMDDCNLCLSRDVHSCSCIPTCCDTTRRIHCRPRSTKPTNYPPRPCSPCCGCAKCCPKSPAGCGGSGRRSRRRASPCGAHKVSKCPPPSCGPCGPCGGPCQPPKRCCCSSCSTERCKRCGEKVFAAEKVLTSCGAYHLGCFSCCCCCKSLCAKTMYEASGEIYCKQCYKNYFGLNGYGYNTECC